MYQLCQDARTISRWGVMGERDMPGIHGTSENQERTLADSLPVICFAADPDGRLRWLNRRWDEYAGDSPELDAEARWRRASDRSCDTPHQDGFASGEPFHWVESLRGVDGEAHLSAMCKQRGGRFVSMNSQAPLPRVLFDDLRRKGWVR